MDYINLGVTFILILVVFSFIYYPKKKQEQMLKEMQDALKIGDRVITYSGLSGEIMEIQKERVVLALNPDNMRISVEKWAIAGLDETNIEKTAKKQ